LFENCILNREKEKFGYDVYYQIKQKFV